MTAGEPRRADPGRTGFGFDDDSWFERLRCASSPGGAALGRLDAYELLEQIGQGGQATVYKARQPGTGRLVAIKRVRTTGLDDRSLARFQREIEVAAALRHPGIVTVHELVDQERALVMEWIDGRPLDAWADAVRDGPDGVRVIVTCVRSACEAVVHAHSRGVIHRDLKPSNILVESVEGAARPRVLDFGLARDATRDEVTLTLQGSFAGTPVYAPPEQIDRGLHEADVRADVYAMGAVLYRALTGHEPFEAPTLARLFDVIRSGRFEPPSARNPRIDDELASIVRTALQTDPAARYATMADLADDLRRWLNREAIRAHPPSMTYFARAFVRRHRAGVALVSVALFLIAGSAVAASVLSWRLNQKRVELTRTVGERDEALKTVTAQRDAAELESRASSSVNHFLAQFMMRLAEAGPESRELLLTMLQRKAREMDESPVRMRPEIDARLRMTVARTLRVLGDQATSQSQALQVIELCERFNLGQTDRDQAYGLIRALRMDAGKYDEVLAELRPKTAAPAADGSYAPHALITCDDEFVEALARSGLAAEAQAYLDSMLPPARATPEQARILAAPYRRLCVNLGLKHPEWMAELPVPVPPGGGL